MSGWLISLLITLALGVAAWLFRNNKSKIFHYGSIIAFVISALVLLTFIPSGNPLLVNKDNPGHLPR